MRADSVKRCIGLGILLLMTGCGVGESTEPELNPQEKLQTEAETQTESEPHIESESQPESAAQSTESYIEDDEFYVQCLQNLHQGNSITYADGYYYFRSQTKDYSLCRTQGAGMPVEVVADQIPGSIYVREDRVYFINVSDSRTLYRVGTDGSELTKLSDFPMQELIVWEDKIYFRSVYDREYDPFYQLTEDAAEGDRYLYSMNLDGSGCELLVPKVCMTYMTDGKWLYYQVYEEGEGYVLYKSGLDGEEEEAILHKERWIYNILPYQGDLYWIEYVGDLYQRQLVRLDAQGEETVLASDVWYFTIARGQAYVMCAELRTIELTTGEESLFAERGQATGSDDQNIKDTYSWGAGSYNSGTFLVNGQVFARYFESEDKGVLWHVWDGESFVVFEDMEPLTPEELVLDTSWLNGEFLYYYPGRTDENAEQYLDGEYCCEESFGTREDGAAYGNFSITLPKFNSKLPSYEQLNRQMEELVDLALEDKESFFRELSELDRDQYIPTTWQRHHGYRNLYVGGKYISMYYYRGGYEGGMRDWNESLPLIFDRETGLMLHLDDLFTVDEIFYKKRLTSAIYKYCEMKGWDDWNEPFDNNVLVKNFNDLRCYLTPDGIVICYERYEIAAGVAGSPTFEIPYERFEDIFKQ